MIQLPQSRALANLSLTPLIDVVFLLVIFFLVSSRFSEEERRMEINVPDSVSAEPLTTKPKELIINISSKGEYIVGEKVLSSEELKTKIYQHKQSNPTKNNVVVRADRDCRFEPVFYCVDLCRQIGIIDYCVTAKGVVKHE